MYQPQRESVVRRRKKQQRVEFIKDFAGVTLALIIFWAMYWLLAIAAGY